MKTLGEVLGRHRSNAVFGCIQARDHIRALLVACSAARIANELVRQIRRIRTDARADDRFAILIANGARDRGAIERARIDVLLGEARAAATTRLLDRVMTAYDVPTPHREHRDQSNGSHEESEPSSLHFSLSLLGLDA
jgi:hypothetical protein